MLRRACGLRGGLARHQVRPAAAVSRARVGTCSRRDDEVPPDQMAACPAQPGHYFTQLIPGSWRCPTHMSAFSYLDGRIACRCVRSSG